MPLWYECASFGYMLKMVLLGFGGRTEKERKERDTLIEGIIKGLTRSIALGKFQGIHKDDPS